MRSACSTASMARTTPAQKPRGEQSRIVSGGLDKAGLAGWRPGFGGNGAAVKQTASGSVQRDRARDAYATISWRVQGIAPKVMAFFRSKPVRS
jgi:hypothetical protein